MDSLELPTKLNQKNMLDMIGMGLTDEQIKDHFRHLHYDSRAVFMMLNRCRVKTRLQIERIKAQGDDKRVLVDPRKDKGGMRVWSRSEQQQEKFRLS